MYHSDEESLLDCYEELIDRLIEFKIRQNYPDIGNLIDRIIQNPFYSGRYKIFIPPQKVQRGSDK